MEEKIDKIMEKWADGRKKRGLPAKIGSAAYQKVYGQVSMILAEQEYFNALYALSINNEPK